MIPATDDSANSVRNIVCVAHTAQVSGAENVLLQVVGEAVKSGYTVTVACPTGQLSRKLPDGCCHRPIAPLGLSGQRGLARWAAAARLAVRWVVVGRALSDLVRQPGTVTVVNSLLALPAVRMARPPGGAAWLVHDFVTSRKQRAVARVGRPVVRRAVTMAQAPADPLRAAGFPVVVSACGVPWPVPSLAGPLHKTPVVGMLALLTPWKGQEVLLDAVAAVPGVEVEFAGGHFPGDEEYLAALQERACRPDLVGRVRFLGHVDPRAAMRGWDAVISASTSPECSPLSVLEAMSCEKPVIGTSHGGTVEFLADGAGLLVPPGDSVALAAAVVKVIGDETLRRQLGANGRERVRQHHDINRTLPELLHNLVM